MKPIFLKFCGINSYETELCIDFEELVKDGIFGIFGPTGSGKSTILDAITLALYGKVPRHNKTTHSSFINSASATASVEFVFEAMHDDGKSRFEIHRVYKRNNKGGVNVSKCLFRVVGGDILADRKEGEVNAAIMAAVGLNYDDFTRSVFLPQGKFNEFMFLESKDRGKMLERLFDLEKFGESLKARVNTFESRAKAAVDASVLKVSFYDGVSDEILTAKQGSLRDISEEITRLSDERELFFGERERYKALEAVYMQYLAAQKEQDGHASQAEEIEMAMAVLTAAKKVDALQSPIINLKSLTAQHEQARKSLAATQQLVKAAGEQAQRCEAEHATARKALETGFPVLLKKEQELNSHMERLGEIEQEEKELRELRDKWRIEDVSLKEKKKEEEEIGAKAADINAKLTEIAQRKSEALVDPEILKVLIEAADVEKDLHKRNHEIGRLEADLSEYRKSIANYSDALVIQEHKLTELFAKNQSNHAAQLAQNLESGIPCPVCGSTHHPNLAQYSSEPADGADLEQLQKDVEGTKEKLNRALVMKESASKSLAELMQKKADLSELLQRHSQSLSIDNFAVALSAAFEKNAERAALESQEAVLRAGMDGFTRIQQSLVPEISRLAALQDATLEAGKQKAATIEAKRAMLGAFGDFDAAKIALTDVESQKLSLTITEKELEDLKAKYHADYMDAEKELATLTERVQNLESICEVQQATIEKELATCGFDSIEAAEGAILPQSQMVALEAKIMDYKLKKSELAGLLSSLLKVLENIDNPEDIPRNAQTADEKFASADAALMEKREASAILTQEVAKMTADLEILSELLSQKKKLEVRHAALREIADLFRGNAFIKFLATRHLQYITNDATTRLKRMTSGRYAIEYDDDTNFIIRDDFNGGARRPPASLSGGETFMASLCLALALSAKIQMKSHTDLSFFFLDEGFGALDMDSLNIVMDALAQLHEENMAVGLISHVDEMKHRIHNKIELS